MSKPEAILEQSFEEVVETVKSLQVLNEKISRGEATTDEKVGDIVLRFCLGGDQHRKIEPVKAFWESVDELVKSNPGQIIVASSDGVNPLMAGRIEADNDGLTSERGRPIFPLSAAAAYVKKVIGGRWVTMNPGEFGLPINGYEIIEALEEDDERPSPGISLEGEMSMGWMKTYFCGFAVGEEQVGKYLESERLPAIPKSLL
jgi:hypothetical protein